ncbi:sodium:alanine symporter family protein [Pseudoramibacter faecis]|uniref:alanine/glycine:cation symporter family protein n=1 Tax=Pseudoramibacter faecis TaxID=3108534 RepID=UPI002E784003|nr:sodium:alanine symporter family protein [Pseudoramibacter sp. HA2172]
MQTFTHFLGAANAAVWGIPMLVLLVGTGIFLSVRLGFLQFRHFGHVLRETVGKLFSGEGGGDGALTPIQAMTTALAGTVGTGNIAGVAGAISLGGPGAIFWMWVAALFGMCTKFSEIVLAVHFRERNSLGDWIGGPMYYIKNGLGKRWRWLGALFAFFAAIAAIGTGNLTQINTIATSIGAIFAAYHPAMTAGQLQIVYLAVGIVGAILTVMVLFGGMQRIGIVTEKLVPVMALVYIVATLAVVIGHASALGSVFALIFESAFSPRAVGGGLAGVAIVQVVKAGFGRGIFSNEAGLGTAPIAHAAANVSHPVRQGLFGVFEVFADTIVICTLTALTILISGCAPAFYGKTAGADLTISAFATTFGNKAAAIIIAVCITMFAFSTLLSWSLYGARATEFLFGTKSIKVYQALYILFVIVGANVQLAVVWQIADTMNALMAIPNLIAVLALSPTVVQLAKAYFAKRGHERPRISREINLPDEPAS